MPTRPRWLLALPDAIVQLEALDRDVLTRRDIERLFGVSKSRAAILMRTFGAGTTGHLRTLPRKALLSQLKALRRGATYRGEVDRRTQLATTLQQARIRGIRVPVAATTHTIGLSGLPTGVTLTPGQIAVQFESPRDAVAKLFALAKALVNDYERFEQLVGTKTHD